MNRDNSHIDEWLKQQLEGVELTPAPEMWEAIEAKMDARKRRFPLWAWVSAASIAVVSLGVWVASHSVSSSAVSESGAQGPALVESQSPVIAPSPEQSVSAGSAEHEANVGLYRAPIPSTFPSSSLASTSGVGEVYQGLLPPVFEPYSKALSIRVFRLEPFLQNQLVVSAPRDSQRSDKGPWYLEVGFDQNQTGILYSAVPVRSSYIHKNYFDRVQQGEFSLQSARLSFSVQRDIQEHLRLHAGLAWAQNRRGQSFDFQDSMPASSAVGTVADAFGNYPIFGYLSPGPRVQYQGQSTLNFLSIPIGLSFRPEAGRHGNWVMDAQLQANLISGQGGKTLNYHYLTLEDWSDDAFQTWFLSARVAAGWERELRPGLSWSILGNMQGAMTPLYQAGSAVKAHAWSAGLSTQLIWSLKGGRP